MTNTVTTIDAALKQYYRAGKLVRLAYKNHPFMALVPKRKDFVGRDIPIVPWFAGTAGRSRTFATALANVSEEETVQFSLRRKKDYGLAKIEMEALLATENDEGAFLKLGTDAVENTTRQVSGNIAMSLYRNHGGARGRISAINSDTITLTNPGDVVNFEYNMKLKHASTDGTSGSLEAEAAQAVTAIDRTAGTVTISDATGFDVGNYLFAEGDFGAALNGIDSWIPSSVSGGESFLGVDRSVDSRLRGLYLDTATLGMGYIEALEYADALLVREGGSPSHLFMNPLDLRVLKSSLGSQVEYDFATSPDQVSISFKSLVLPSSGGGGALKILGDPDCPEGYAYMLTMDSWIFATLGDAPRGLEAKGFKFITSEEADSVQIRCGMYGNLGCYASSHNARIKLK